MCAGAEAHTCIGVCAAVCSVTPGRRAGWTGQSCHITAPHYGTVVWRCTTAPCYGAALRHHAMVWCSDSRQRHHAPRVLPTLLPVSRQLAAGPWCECSWEATFGVWHPKEAGNLPPHHPHGGRLWKWLHNEVW